MRFQEKVILITGGASGIGLALANRLAERGATLALADIHEDKLASAAAMLKTKGVRVSTTVVDVTSNAAVDDWVASTLKEFGRIDGAANVAGTGQGWTQFEDLENEWWEKIIGVNLTGSMYCMRAQVRAMKKGGSIVNVASLAGLRGRAGLAAYTASKHGLVGLSKAVAKEMGPKGIRVNVVAPGPIETPLLDMLLKSSPTAASSSTSSTYSTLPLQRMGQPEEVASTLEFLLSDEASYITGSIFSVDGGAAA
ncbi:hypothetical protein LTS17_007991 [Exophiala oligosperma]